VLPLLRYTLDLFSTGPAGPEPSAASGKRDAEPALPRTAFVPGEPLQRAIAPVRFAHPDANRETRIQDAVVAYAFLRAKRRTIGFIVGPDGLVVRAPRWTPLFEVEAALQEKGGWILRKLQESQERQSRRHSARVEWCDGVVIPFLGQDLTVLLDPSHGFSGRGAQLKPVSEASSNQTLHVGLPKAASADQIRDAVQAWLMRQARILFAQRLDYFAPQLQVQWSRLSLSNAGTRWGSAKSDGSIRLHWRLMHFDLAVIDYVVAHELSHLRVMNHSPRFWATVGTVVPDYPAQRQALKNSTIALW